MTRSLILSGAGPYTDPWHDFAATSARLAGILTGLGHGVRISSDLPAELARLADPSGPSDPDGVDLLVVNAATGPPGGTPDGAEPGLAAHLARGGAVLAVHIGVCGLLDLASWREVSGATWVPDRTMHPPIGRCHVDVVPAAHPIVSPPGAPAAERPTTGSAVPPEPVESFELLDERYTFLDLAPGSTVLVTHRHEDADHPLVWTRTLGPARVVSDTLGHDVRSYDSAGHRRLLERAVRWLTGDLG